MYSKPDESFDTKNERTWNGNVEFQNETYLDQGINIQRDKSVRRLISFERNSVRFRSEQCSAFHGALKKTEGTQDTRGTDHATGPGQTEVDSTRET